MSLGLPRLVSEVMPDSLMSYANLIHNELRPKGNNIFQKNPIWPNEALHEWTGKPKIRPACRNSLEIFYDGRSVNRSLFVDCMQTNLVN